MGTREPVPDMFRFCVYCDADCYDEDGDALPKDEVDHRPDCPTVTGLYPVRPEDHGPEVTCPKCGHQFREYSVTCMDCGTELEEGDSYAHRRISADVVELVCVPCSLLNPSDYQIEQNGEI